MPLLRLSHIGAALIVAAAMVIAGGRHRPLAAQAIASPCAIETTERVVAVGDVHGAYDPFVRILRAAGLVDRRDRWIGGRAMLIQTGDVFDRGAESRRVVDLLRRLERDAARAGGRVIPLLGNHEFMRIVGDWRYVSEGEYRAFRRGDSEELRERAHARFADQAAQRARAEDRTFDAADYREQFMKEIPLGYLEMRLAFDAGTDYGDWVRTRLAAVKVNGVLFLHGGVSPTVAALGCEGLNDAVRADLDAVPVPPDALLSLLSTKEEGPLWYRGLATEPEATFTPTLEMILQRMGARAIVVGHTPVTRVTARFGGRVVLIDTGMLDGEFYPGGRPSALELHEGRLTAIYEDQREVLAIPARTAPRDDLTTQ